MYIQMCVTNVLTGRAILIGQLFIPFFQNEMVSHLPTYRGGGGEVIRESNGLLIIDDYCIS